jgi:hypothetical protein
MTYRRGSSSVPPSPGYSAAGPQQVRAVSRHWDRAVCSWTVIPIGSFLAASNNSVTEMRSLSPDARARHLGRSTWHSGKASNTRDGRFLPVVDRALIYIVEISNVKQPTAHADVSRFTRACEASAQRHFPAVAHFLLANARAAVLDAGLVGDDVSDTS